MAMCDPVSEPQLVLEAFEELRIGGDLGLQNLERQDLAGLAIAGLVHDAHAAAAQLAEDLVSRRQCYRGRQRIHGHRFGQVLGTGRP
jgi:hypothetical protein